MAGFYIPGDLIEMRRDIREIKRMMKSMTNTTVEERLTALEERIAYQDKKEEEERKAQARHKERHYLREALIAAELLLHINHNVEQGADWEYKRVRATKAFKDRVMVAAKHILDETDWDVILNCPTCGAMMNGDICSDPHCGKPVD